MVFKARVIKLNKREFGKIRPVFEPEPACEPEPES